MRKYMSKRQRPCDFCRSRKTACRIESAPPCRSCQLHGKECTFVAAAPPRKRMAVDAPLPHHSEGDYHCDGMALVAAEAGVLGVGPEAPQLLAPTSGFASGEVLPRSTGDASSPAALSSPGFPDMGMQFLDELDMDGSAEDFMFRSPRSPASSPFPARGFTTMSPQSQSAWPARESSDILLDNMGGSLHPETLGLTGDMDPYVLQRYQADDRGLFKFKQLAIQAVCQDPIPVQFLVSQPSILTRSREEAGNSLADDAELRKALEQEISAEIGKRLMALFQKFIAPQYPIFSTEQLPDPALTPPHLLAAIYMIAFPFAMYDDQLCIELAYDSPPYQRLSHILNTALAADLHSPSIALVQTLFLVVARPSSNPLVSDASYRWSRLGTLIASAVNIGLHLDPSGWKISAAQISQRRRLSFIIYSTDKWLAASLGRPPQITYDNWLVTSLFAADQHGSGLTPEQWEDMLDFSALTSIIDSTLSRLYSLRNMQTLLNDPQRGLDTAKNVIHSLDPKYRDRTPEGASNAPSMFSTIIRLGHHHVVLLALRAALRPLLSTHSSPHSDTQGNVRMEMLNCVSKFSQFIKSLKVDEVNGFWPPWCQPAISSLCFAQLLMTMTSPTYEEAVSWIKGLQQTRRSLRLQSNSLQVLRLGLLRIDAIFWCGADKVLRLEPHVAEAFKASTLPGT